MTTELLDSIVSSNSQELSNASSALKLFENPLFKVRVIMRCAEPWFVAKDVATSIEHSNVTKMCELCRDKDIAIVNGKEYSNDLLEYSESRGNPNLTVISESGLYRILAKCNLPKCEPDVDEDEEQRIYDALKEKGVTCCHAFFSIAKFRPSQIASRLSSDFSDSCS